MTPRHITARTTVNEITRRLPGAVTVFSRYGIDACCGGSLSLQEATKECSVSVEFLLEELGKIAAQPDDGGSAATLSAHPPS